MKSTASKLIALFAALVLVAAFSACRENGSGPDGIDPSLTGDADSVADSATMSAPAPDESVTAPETAPETDTETPTESETDYFEANRIELVKPDTERVPDMAVTDNGYDIYQLTKDREWGYRYGCTYLYNEDGSVDAYFACVGQNTGEWDWIAYRHSPDGGTTWGEEKIVLTPTQNSMDFYSNCDPGVVYFNGYYYLGYTSTLNSTGLCNNLFVARSKNPDGPFDKWNGEGWGGYEPQPIVYYDETWTSWGIGEPAFVELNGTLYIYYTHSGPSGEYMMVATADATNENWPATMQHRGAACKKSTDSLDVKYVEEWGKFIGIATGDRMGANSWLGVYESNDGLSFELSDIVREGTYSHLHNAGISSRPNGHIRVSEDADKLRVIYAYGEGWGTWNTRVQPITLSLSSGNDMSAERIKPCLPDEGNRAELLPVEERHIAMVRPRSDVYYRTTETDSFIIQLNVFDTYFGKTALDRNAEGVTFFVHDERVITMGDNRRAKVVGAGTTAVDVTYAGCTYRFHVVITEEPINKGHSSTPVELVPVRDTYTLCLGERSVHRAQLRARMWWANGTFTEYYVDNGDVTVTYSGYDQSIISVDERGIITPLKTGTTEVTLSYAGKSCKIKVVVTNDPEDAYYRLDNIVEINYADLDFSVAGTEEGLGSLHGTALEYSDEYGAMKATVTGGDPQFWIPCSHAPVAMKAADYGTLEITYMVPADTSSAAVNLQVFLCVGDITTPDATHQVMLPIKRDGEFHTLTVSLSSLSYWTGDIHTVRVDFFDQATVGDVMYIQSIKLLP